MADNVAFKQKALFRAVPGLFSQRSLFSNATPFDDMSVEIQTLNAIVKSYNGSLYLPNISNFENTTVATGIDDAAELDDPIAYAGDLTTYNQPENMLINSVFEGAAENTLPTGYGTTLGTFDGITFAVINAGVSSITFSISGTATATTGRDFFFVSNANIPATKPGEILTASCNAVIGGNKVLPASKLRLRLAEYNSAVSSLDDANTNLSSATNGLVVVTKVINQALSVYARNTFRVFYSSGDVFDFTVTISNLQLERGRARTYVPTTTAAISRGTFNPAFQATTANKPFLRSKDYSRAQWVSGQNNLGAELLSNPGPTFTETTGWSTTAGGTISVSSGALRITANTNGTNAPMSTPFTTVIGAKYLLTVRPKAETSTGGVFFYAGTSATGTQYGARSFSFGAGTLEFTATATTSYVSLQLLATSVLAGEYAEIESISVKELLAGTGETWSITNTAVAAAAGIQWGDGEAYLRCPGVVGNVATTPDSGAADIVGDISAIIKLEAATLTPASDQCIWSKWAITGNQRSSRLDLKTDGKLIFYHTADGATASAKTSTAAVPAGTTHIKLLVDVNDGAGSHTVEFQSSPDGATYTRIGNVVTTAGVIALYSGSAAMALGGSEGATGSAPFSGKIYYAAIYNNATATGTPAVEFYPARDAIRPSAAAWDFDNSNDYLQTPINPTSSGYICVAARQDEALGSVNALIGAYKGSATIQAGIALRVLADGKLNLIRSNSAGGGADASTSTAITAGGTFVTDANWEVTSAKVRINGAGEGTSALSVDAANSGTILTIGGRNTGSSAVPGIFDVYGGAIFGAVHIPSVPSAADQATIRKLMGQIAGVSGVV